jgi:hypothetical protein
MNVVKLKLLPSSINSKPEGNCGEFLKMIQYTAGMTKLPFELPFLE